MVTCVYTYDFEDLNDVRRVLVALRHLDFPRARLSYKRDVDTLGDAYGDGVSIYESQPGSEHFEDRRSDHGVIWPVGKQQRRHHRRTLRA
jgi:hypothetical protein